MKLAKGFNARFLYDPEMSGRAIDHQDDYFKYGFERGLSIAHSGVVDTIEYRNDAAFQATASGFPEDHFIGEWTGVVVIKQGGSYTFASSSDDGSHIWIDGRMVVSNEGIHPVRKVTGTIDLTAGRHTVKVDFFENEVNPRTPNPQPQTLNPKPPPSTPNPKP